MKTCTVSVKQQTSLLRIFHIFDTFSLNNSTIRRTLAETNIFTRFLDFRRLSGWTVNVRGTNSAKGTRQRLICLIKWSTLATLIRSLLILRPVILQSNPLEQKCLVFVKDMDERKVCSGKQREPVVRDISENIHISAEKIVRKRFSKFYSGRNGASIPWNSQVSIYLATDGHHPRIMIFISISTRASCIIYRFIVGKHHYSRSIVCWVLVKQMQKQRKSGEWWTCNDELIIEEEWNAV